MANSLSPGSKVPVLHGEEKKTKSTFVFAFQIPQHIQFCSGNDNINFLLPLIFSGKQLRAESGTPVILKRGSLCIHTELARKIR